MKTKTQDSYQQAGQSKNYGRDIKLYSHWLLCGELQQMGCTVGDPEKTLSPSRGPLEYLPAPYHSLLASDDLSLQGRVGDEVGC